MEFSFLHPQFLIFLLAIPIFLFIHFLALTNRKKKALGFANFDAIAKIKGVDFFSKNIIVLVMNLVIIVLLVFALSGLTLHTEAISSSFSYVIGIDSSQSMEADDFFPTRIDAAKSTAKSFVDLAPLGVKMGVISFSGATKLELELTERKDEIRGAIDGISISGIGGTDPYEAVLASVNLLKGEEHRSLILLSDGQINIGDIEETIYYANKNNLIIHTIGIATAEGGNTSIGFSKLDESTLQGLAYNTGGNYTHASNESLLKDAFSGIFQFTNKNVSIELLDYLLMVAILLILLEFFLSNTRYVNLP